MYKRQSQESVFATGLPHKNILESIVDDVPMSAYDLSRKIVDEYASYYQYAQSATISAWDMNLLENLSNAIDDFAQLLLSDTTYHTQIENAYYETESFSGIGVIDIYDFAFNIQKNLMNESSVYHAARGVMENVTKVVFSEWHDIHQNAHGISIYFPPEENYVISYENTDFALHTHWDEFLQTFYDI